MKLEEKHKKIDIDLKNGLKSKAVNRLYTLIQQNPNEIDLRNKLAEIYYESGFLDSAGKFWLLTEPNEPRIKKCVEIYEKSVNHSSQQILKDIVFRGDKNSLPEYSRNRLNQLEIDSQEKYNIIPEYKPKQKLKTKGIEKPSKIGSILIPLFILLILTIIIIGLVTSFKWLFL